MTTTDGSRYFTGTGAGATPARSMAVPVGAIRDPRLDFYRGIAMFIILIAHTPGNFLTLWIPARFGFSDATEIFVFASGMASAIAFGRAFDSKGWLIGTSRVTFRVWQVYWAHIALFFAIATLMATIDSTGLFTKNYTNSLNLVPFFRDTAQNLIGLLTLTYVPNYFDILPMYLGILAMMPIFVGLANVSRALAGAAVVAVWLGANFEILWMPAEPWSEREWFFNPFGWQLVFFTGFAFMRGWLPAPPVNRVLVALAIVVVLASVPFAYFRILREVEMLREARGAIKFLIEKTDFGLFRYIHFLALAYLGWAVAGEGGKRLIATGSGLLAVIWRGVLAVVMKVGQQSLAVFVFSMFVARVIGFSLDVIGRSILVTTIANLIGFGLLILVAYTVAWFKSSPWRKKT
ncbi:MAG: OpgC family protein [Halocynthiibacter sp.]